MSKRILDRLKQAFGEAILETHSQHGDDTAVVDASRWKEIARFLRDDERCAMNHFIDLTAVDYLDRREPRYEIVLHVRSVEKLHRVRLKARIGEPPQIDTLSEVWAGANWFERECFDMFGVDFVGHPDLRRILLYPEFVGHPLRKDYPADRTQPLVEYRAEALGKLPPFDEHEGMPFGRQTHGRVAERVNALGFSDE
ncbi:MAG: NADH-quinone oxidoreductase subunit C [Deltaproteobacteria bacterium]|nr:NADH-quinone oxidoreductase subunit C [Deltaproteobacteria bacterium]